MSIYLVSVKQTCLYKIKTKDKTNKQKIYLKNKRKRKKKNSVHILTHILSGVAKLWYENWNFATRLLLHCVQLKYQPECFQNFE